MFTPHETRPQSPQLAATTWPRGANWLPNGVPLGTVGFHVLVHIPDREELTEAEALRRVGVLYNDTKVLEYRQAWERWRKEGHEEVIQQDLDRLSARMYDVSEFVKTVKQRFSMWYNHKEGRRGTLWEDPPSLATARHVGSRAWWCRRANLHSWRCRRTST
jgi:hypothetical protein